MVNVENRREITGEGQKEGEDTEILEELKCQTVTFNCAPYSELWVDRHLVLQRGWYLGKAGSWIPEKVCLPRRTQKEDIWNWIADKVKVEQEGREVSYSCQVVHWPQKKVSWSTRGIGRGFGFGGFLFCFFSWGVGRGTLGLLCFFFLLCFI